LTNVSGQCNETHEREKIYKDLMTQKKSILAIIGSASTNSVNLKLLERIVNLTEKEHDRQ